jgi:chromosomal replication initiator protein
MNDLEITPELLEVLDIIAQNIQSNIRELEGAFTRVLAHSKLTDKVITKDFAKNVLSEVFNTKTKELTPSYIKETVAKYFGVRISDMESQKRARSIAYPRQIAIYLIRTKTKYSLPNIGDCFGGRDHTTILHSYEKISEEIKTNQELRNTIENIERMLTD